MTKILLIHDTDQGADTLLSFASRFAADNRSALVIAGNRIRQSQFQLSGYELPENDTSMDVLYLDISHMNARSLANKIQQEEISLVMARASDDALDISALLGHLSCPLMLIPESLGIFEVKRMVYLTDLRYAQCHIVQQLNRLESLSMLIAHICEAGLPDLYPSYGCELFADTMTSYGMGQKVMYTHIRETDLSRVVDTLTHTLRADVLAFSNQKFDWRQLLVSIPLLIFPS